MNKQNIWLHVSDLMTGLMVIFLFVAIAYISRVNRHSVELSQYVEARQNLHDKLVSRFRNDTARWNMTIGRDLSLRFNDPTVLYRSGSWEITPAFKDILDEFLPVYFDILLSDSLRNNISEVRIEGHTDPQAYPALSSDAYIANVILSQRRALSVLQYFRAMPHYREYSDEQIAMLEYWFTANGLSYGRALDNEGQYAFDSGDSVDFERSRRVEFRIITNSEKMVEDFIKNITQRQND